MSRINAPPIPATVITSTSPGAITANPFPYAHLLYLVNHFQLQLLAQSEMVSTTSPATAFVAILFIIV